MSDLTFALWGTAHAQEFTEVDPGTPKGEQTSEVPPIFYWALWVPAFFVLVYMFVQLLGPRIGVKVDPGPPTSPPEDGPSA